MAILSSVWKCSIEEMSFVVMTTSFSERSAHHRVLAERRGISNVGS
jgi:hypothetical protein